jgi:SseB protein N-terminal domain
VAGRRIDPGLNSASANDDGAADPVLARALAGGEEAAGPARISAALIGARLLVPIAAAPSGGEHGAQLALISMIGRDGRRALPAFTSVDALSRWRGEARPVPVPAQRAAAAAYEEEAVALILDVAGPIPHWVTGSRLAALAEGRAWQPAHDDEQVAAAVRGHLQVLAGTAVAGYVRPSENADAVVILVPATDSARAQVNSVARALATRLSTDPLLRARLDTGLDIAVASSAKQVLERRVDGPG